MLYASYDDLPTPSIGELVHTDRLASQTSANDNPVVTVRRPSRRAITP